MATVRQAGSAGAGQTAAVVVLFFRIAATVPAWSSGQQARVAYRAPPRGHTPTANDAHAPLDVAVWQAVRSPEPTAFRSDIVASDQGEVDPSSEPHEPARRGIFLENCPTAEAWPNCWEDTMAGPNKKLVAAAEAYFADLRQVRASGGATAERSYYPALEGLLRAVGATLKPMVFCVQELADQGAGHPDLALYTARQVQKGRPRPGQVPERGVVEVKGVGDDACLTAGSGQVSRYWGRYRVVLVTNLRNFVLVARTWKAARQARILHAGRGRRRLLAQRGGSPRLRPRCRRGPRRVSGPGAFAPGAAHLEAEPGRAEADLRQPPGSRAAPSLVTATGIKT